MTNPPVNRCQVLSFYLNFGLGKKKENGLSTQGLQSSCGTHPSKQENYTVRLPGCPDFTSPGLGFGGCDLLALDQPLIQPIARAAAFPALTKAALLCQMLGQEMISACPSDAFRAGWFCPTGRGAPTGTPGWDPPLSLKGSRAKSRRQAQKKKNNPPSSCFQGC